MKYGMFFFSALLLIWINCGQAEILQIDTMDYGKMALHVKDPNWGTLSSGILKSHSVGSYRVNSNKTFILYAPTGYSMLAAVKFIDLRPFGQDKLTLFAINESVAPLQLTNSYSFQRKNSFPGEDKTFFALKGQLGVTFATGSSFSSYGYNGFQLTYTVQADWRQCNTGDFTCRNGRCIARILHCDGHNHCGDGSSNYNCYKIDPDRNTGRTAGIVGGVVFLLIAIACGIFIVVRRTNRSSTESQTIINHPPPPPAYPQPGTCYPPPPPSYPQPGTCYPPPPPPYSPGVTNPYH